MKTLVVYDSFFGNTEKIAQAVGSALGSAEDVSVVRVSEAKPEQLAGVALLIIGSPTRGFRPTPAIVSFLDKLPAQSLNGVKVAAFDTRIALAEIKPAFVRALAGVFGYAAKPMADKLKQKGGELTAPPEGFFVADSEGPLKEGELERAVVWAQRLKPS